MSDKLASGGIVLLNRNAILNLVEAAQVAGVDRAALLAPFQPELGQVIDGARQIEWRTFTQLLEHLGELVGNDEERLREIGRRITHVPSYDVVRRVVRGVVSVPMLYRAADRWLTTANFPSLRVFMRFLTDERMQMHLEIPPKYAPSRPFLLVSEGAVETLPEVLGMPRAVVLERRITPSTSDLELMLPRMPARQRLRSLARSLAGFRTARAILDEQRGELLNNMDALSRARDELRDVLDRLPNLVMVHADGKILWVNRPWLATLGYEHVSEVVGLPVLDSTAPRSRAAVRESIARAPGGETGRAGESRALTEVVLLGRTGKEVVVEVAPATTIVFEGTPARLIVARDITDRVMMQQRLLVADRMAAVGMLAAGVAHEVNNPLAYILNNIEIALKQLAVLGSPATVARQSLTIALEGVDRIRTVVRDLLMLARGEDGDAGPIDVRTVAESTIALARPKIDALADLVLDFGPAPSVHATEGRVAQILLNLIGNALEAMRGLPREACTLVVRIARASDGRVLLEVSDSGRGISPADIERLFEPFFTTKPAGEGTGLGLPIVQRLVMELGGEITVSSEPGRGTSFRVFLPPAASSADSGAPRPPSPAPAASAGALD